MAVSGLLVDQSKLGTAYGLMTMIQNIGLAGFNLMVGWANDYSSAGADKPCGYNLRDVDFLDPGVSGAGICLPAPPAGTWASWPWTGDDHDCKAATN